MAFELSKSKLFAPIMESAARFFGLGESATETEIHDKLSGEPLETILENARTAAVAENGQKLADLETRFTALETSLSEKEKEIATKDARILEMTLEVSETAKTIETLQNDFAAAKEQHKNETRKLAGEISSLRAGRIQEEAPGDEPHEVTNVKDAAPLPNGQLPMVSKELQALTAAPNPQY